MNEITKSGAYLPSPQSFEEAYRIAKVLAASDLVPKDYKDKPENCLVAMQWGADVGLPGLQALQNIAVINGRPSIWGDAAKALVLNSDSCEDIEEFIEGQGDSMVAVCIAKRKGRKPVEQRFSVEDAKKAGLWTKQGPWTSYPKRMLQMRARSFALRDAFPDALRGLSIAEEAQDMVVVDGVTGEVTRQKPTPEDKQNVVFEQAPALQVYSDEDFAKNKPSWQKAIEAGKKTPAQIIAFLKQKATLTQDQELEIESWSSINEE